MTHLGRTSVCSTRAAALPLDPLHEPCGHVIGHDHDPGDTAVLVDELLGSRAGLVYRAISNEYLRHAGRPAPDVGDELEHGGAHVT